MSERKIPLPIREVPCWRCGAPSTMQGLRLNLCETCKAAVAEIEALHQQTPPATEEKEG